MRLDALPGDLADASLAQDGQQHRDSVQQRGSGLKLGIVRLGRAAGKVCSLSFIRILVTILTVRILIYV